METVHIFIGDIRCEQQFGASPYRRVALWATVMQASGRNARRRPFPQVSRPRTHRPEARAAGTPIEELFVNAVHKRVR